MSAELYGPGLPRGTSGVTQWAEVSTFYVGKEGSDSNPGTSINLPKLTIEAAYNAAKLLVPTPFSQAQIIIGPGVYMEALQLDTTFIHLTALTPGTVFVLRGVDGLSPLTITATGGVLPILVTNVYFAVAGGTQSVITTAGAGRKNSVKFSRSLVANFSPFAEPLVDDPVGDGAELVFDQSFLYQFGGEDRCAVRLESSSDNYFECHGCDIHGYLSLYGNNVLHDTRVRSSCPDYTLRLVSPLIAPTELSLFDCQVENESTGSAIRVSGSGENRVQIAGGELITADATSYDVDTDLLVHLTKVRVSGVKMSRGLSPRVNLVDQDRRVSSLGDVDFYASLASAVASIPDYETGRVVMFKDEELPSSITVGEGSDVTICGSGRRRITGAHGVTWLLVLAENASLRLESIGVSGGIQFGQNSATLVLSHVVGDPFCLEISGGNAASLVGIKDSVLFGLADRSVIEVSHTDPFIVIWDSFVRGVSQPVGMPALSYAAINDNVYLRNVDLYHGDDASAPIPNPADPTFISATHSRWGATSPIGLNLTNIFGTDANACCIVDTVPAPAAFWDR